MSYLENKTLQNRKGAGKGEKKSEGGERQEGKIKSGVFLLKMETHWVTFPKSSQKTQKLI